MHIKKLTLTAMRFPTDILNVLKICIFHSLINTLHDRNGCPKVTVKVFTAIGMCHFTDQTAEATISKFGLGVLYSIRMKMGIIKSVLMY